MASTKEIVPFAGILKNEHNEASCEGIATKTTLRNPQGMAIAIGFSQFKINNISKSLPDDLYKLIGCGEPVSIRLRNGSWEAA